MTETRIVDDPFGARRSYERLLLQQPDVDVHGLYQLGSNFFAVVPGFASIVTRDGTPFAKWFGHNCKDVAAPLALVDSPPLGATRVAERTVSERVEQVDEFRTRRDVWADLSLSLPKTFPQFSFEATYPTATVTVARALLKEETEALQREFRSVGSGMRLDIRVSSGAPITPSFQRRPQGDIELMPSAALAGTIDNSLRWRLEEDEDFWLSKRSELFRPGATDPDVAVPAEFRRRESRCVISTLGDTGNIRSYMPLYRSVTLIMPLIGRLDRTLAGLGVTEDSLVSLARRGRVQFLMPQSIDRYPIPFLTRLANEAPDSLLFSRRLAAASIVDGRRRLPLLYTTLGVTERREALRELAGVAKATSDERVRALCQALGTELARIWSQTEWSVHRMGAMSAGGIGSAFVIAAVLRLVAARDLAVELTSAAPLVEWAGAVNGTAVPGSVGDYSEQGLVEVCATFYSGLPSRLVGTYQPGMEKVLGDLLAIDNDAPVDQVADAFEGRDVDRLRGIVQRVELHNQDPEFLRDAIDSFNKDVRRFETSRLRNLDVMGVAGTVAALLSPTHAKPFVGLGAGLLYWLLQGKEPPILTDLLRAAATRTSTDVVLVSRLRRNLRV